jgi:hypothetical protein
VRIRLPGLQWDGFHTFAPALARFFQDYPGVAAAELVNVSVVPHSAFGSHGRNVIGVTGQFTAAAPSGLTGRVGSYIQFDGTRLAKSDNYQNSREGWFPEGTNKLRGTLAHELGHVLHNHLDRVMEAQPSSSLGRMAWSDFKASFRGSERLSGYSTSKGLTPKGAYKEPFAEAFAQHTLAPQARWAPETHLLNMFLTSPHVAPLLRQKAVTWFFSSLISDTMGGGGGVR